MSTFIKEDEKKDKGESSGKRGYSRSEEIFNAITHGIGSILGIAALTMMVVISVQQHDGYKLASSIIYGLMIIILYTMSTLYHAITNVKAKQILQVVDHCSIFLLIAGTYTPYTLVALRNLGGWWIFGAIWGSAVLGIILNIIDLKRFKKFSLILYVVMGLCIVLAYAPLSRTMALPGIVLLLAGGACYLLGMVFYMLKQFKFMHGIWHIFVLGGSVCHYLSIFLYIIR